MKIIIEDNWLVSTEKTHHFNIKINNYEYLFVVETLELASRNDIKYPIITSIKRGCTFWDCGKKIKNSDKKKIKKLIEEKIKNYGK